jgi:hypothetical protein
MNGPPLFDMRLPQRACRIIPEERFTGRLGRSDQIYVCVGDHDELRGWPLRQVLGRLYGFPNDPRLENKRTTFSTDRDILAFDRFRVLTITLDASDTLDLFPATWKAIAYILSDQQRMAQAHDIYERFVTVLGDTPRLRLDSKWATDWYECGGSGPDSLWTTDAQLRYYYYISRNSGFTDELVRLFGIDNRCWHGLGCVGLGSTVLSRTFVVRNLPADDGHVTGQRVLALDDPLL